MLPYTAYHRMHAVKCLQVRTCHCPKFATTGGNAWGLSRMRCTLIAPISYGLWMTFPAQHNNKPLCTTKSTCVHKMCVCMWACMLQFESLSCTESTYMHSRIYACAHTHAHTHTYIQKCHLPQSSYNKLTGGSYHMATRALANLSHEGRSA